MKRSALAGSALALFIALPGCSDDKTSTPDAGPAAGSTTPAATASATTSVGAGDKAAQAPAPMCKPLEREVWSEAINARTGLTVQRLDEGKVAVGIALGNQPHRLVFDAEGKGKLEKLALAQGHALARGVGRGKGVRHLQRVTPTSASGAFADYRDKLKDGRRRIACGPLGTAKPYLVFDGEPILDTDDSGRGKTKAEPKPAASAEPATSAAPKSSAVPASSGQAAATAKAATSAAPAATATATAKAAASAAAAATATAAASAAPTAAPPPPPAPAPAPAGPLIELRDCRTFSDAAGKDVWAVGSELRGKREGDEIRWSMHFFVAPDRGRAERVTLYRVPLGTKPKKLHTLEAPVAHPLGDGSFVLTGRYRGELFTWLLDARKRTQGAMHRYRGGYPSMPRLITKKGDTWLLTSQQHQPKKWQLRGLHFGATPALPDKLTALPIATDLAVAAEPMATAAADGRWLSYHADDRRRGALHVVPVDKDLKPLAPAHVVSGDGEQVYESVLFNSGDSLVAVYIVTRPKQAPQLVSQRLACTPPKQG